MLFGFLHMWSYDYPGSGLEADAFLVGVGKLAGKDEKGMIED